MIRRPLVHALAFLASVGLPAAPVAGQAAAGAKPTLVVFITIDQMRSDYYQRFEKQFTGGLKRLFEGGAVFTDAYQDHAITETAPGHAATMSGRFPVHTGIVMNTVGVNTSSAPLIEAAPREPGAAPTRFQGTTLTDWLKTANAQTRFLSVSRKDRGAILPIGRSKGDVYWWSANGKFVTSKYYADTLPTWVKRFNDRRLGHSYAGKTWNLLLPASAYPEPDDVAIESQGNDYVFPHEVPADSATAASLTAGFPWMDDITLSLALTGTNQLGLGSTTGRTDILAISLSTLDAIGHRFGPDSREVHDQLLRLDRAMGVFFDSLFKLRDQQKVVVALTADHGVMPFPTLRSQLYPNQDAKRVSIDVLWRAFADRLADLTVDTSTVFFEEGVVFATKPETFKKAGVNADSAIAAFGAELLRVQGVQRTDLFSSMAKADTTKDTIARRWLHMFRPDGPARLAVTMTPYSYWLSTNYATHGSPHDGDAHVPLLFYGAGVKPGRYTEFVRVVDMAPTLAELVGVKPTEALDGRTLRQAIRP